MPKMIDKKCPAGCDNGKKNAKIEGTEKTVKVNCDLCLGHGKIRVPAKEAK